MRKEIYCETKDAEKSINIANMQRSIYPDYRISFTEHEYQIRNTL